jgi:hypothetical protein
MTRHFASHCSPVDFAVKLNKNSVILHFLFYFNAFLSVLLAKIEVKLTLTLMVAAAFSLTPHSEDGHECKDAVEERAGICDEKLLMVHRERRREEL